LITGAFSGRPKPKFEPLEPNALEPDPLEPLEPLEPDDPPEPPPAAGAPPPYLAGTVVLPLISAGEVNARILPLEIAPVALVAGAEPCGLLPAMLPPTDLCVESAEALVAQITPNARISGEKDRFLIKNSVAAISEV
jgi:hypothetical protein